MPGIHRCGYTVKNCAILSLPTNNVNEISVIILLSIIICRFKSIFAIDFAIINICAINTNIRLFLINNYGAICTQQIAMNRHLYYN
jgi:hypothetical protein